MLHADTTTNACASARARRARNLAAFSLEGPGWFGRLPEAPASALQVLPSRKGPPTLRLAGHYLHSSVDPEQEAGQLVRDERLRACKLVVLFGLGAGHNLRALRRQCPGKVVVFEPSRDVLAYALEALELSGDDTLRPQAVACDLPTLRAALARTHVLGDALTLVVPPAYARAFPAEVAAVSREVELFAEATRLQENTYDLRLGLWIDNLIDNLPWRARFASATTLQGRFAGVPGVLVSAGPSLAQNVEQLRALRDRAVIVSTNTATRALERAGVSPDLVIGLEALDVTPQFRDCARLNESFALLDGVAHPALYELPFRGGFVFDDGIPFYQRWLESNLAPVTDWSCGLCVAHAGFSALRAMGCDPIILVGQDLAHTGGRVYAQGTVFEAMSAVPDGERITFTGTEAKLEIDARSGTDARGMRTFAREEPRVRVPGYYGGEVESTVAFRAFARWFENAALRTGGAPRLINSTEGGALIEGFEAVPLATLASTLGPERGIRESLAAAAREPAIPANRLRQRIAAAADEVGRARRVASRSGGGGAVSSEDLERLRSVVREQPLLNGYVRKEMNALRRDREAGVDAAQLQRKLVRTVAAGASALEQRLRAARARVVGRDHGASRDDGPTE